MNRWETFQSSFVNHGAQLTMFYWAALLAFATIAIVFSHIVFTRMVNKIS